MPRETDTNCSAIQELFVSSQRNPQFQPGDAPHNRAEYQAMNEIMTSEQRGAVAFARFKELMDDLMLSEDAAINFIYDMTGRPTDLGKKAIKQWYSRSSIPPYAVFNIASALGVDVRWLGGSDKITKERAIQRGALYDRERERVASIRAEAWGKRSKRAV